MPLTAEDVKNKQFTHTRMKAGYDEKEVDDFLDEVEAELSRLSRENTDLRTRLQIAEQSARQPVAAQAPAPPPAAPAAVSPPPPAPFAAPPAPVAAVVQPPAAALATPSATGGGEGSQEAALRMLAMAQRTADDTVSDARREADKVLGEAKQKADQLERETQERHRSVVGNLDSERERLERKIEELRSFEREYRARLKSYLEGQLRDLEGRTEGVQPTAPRPVAASGGLSVSGAPAAAPVPASVGAPSAAPAYAAPSFTNPPAAGPGSPTNTAPVPGVQQPPRPPSPFSSVPPPPVPGATPQSTSSDSSGPGAPPRQPAGGGFEVDDGPEVPPSHG